MEDIVYLYGRNGWLTSSSQFTSDRTKAANYTLEEGIEVCSRFKKGGVDVMPVRAEDLRKIK